MSSVKLVALARLTPPATVFVLYMWCLYARTEGLIKSNIDALPDGLTDLKQQFLTQYDVSVLHTVVMYDYLLLKHAVLHVLSLPLKCCCCCCLYISHRASIADVYTHYTYNIRTGRRC
jgi:hypothetical protein